jgi:hypothetical protein
MLLLIIGTVIVGAITGYAGSNQGGFSCGLAGQIFQWVLCIMCFAFVGLVFLWFGWKFAILDLFLLFMASNAGVFFYTYF